MSIKTPSTSEEGLYQLLYEGTSQLGLALSQASLVLFSAYIQEIFRWSNIVDLVSRTDPETIIRKHILDSLIISRLIPSTSRIIDLGSGAGFPGLVLGLIEPARRIVLVEARRKRANFLKSTVRNLRLVNVKVQEKRAETLAHEEAFRSSFDTVTTRATWQLQDFLKLAAPFLRLEGIALAMKGPQGYREFQDLKAKLPDSGFRFQREYSYRLPFGREERLGLVFSRQ